MVRSLVSWLRHYILFKKIQTCQEKKKKKRQEEEEGKKEVSFGDSLHWFLHLTFEFCYCTHKF
jgi:hypothetical protein